MKEFDSPYKQLTSLLSYPIVPLYRKSDRLEPIHVGTGLLVAAGPRVFLVSAGHVIRAMQKTDLYFYINENTHFRVAGKTIFKDLKGDSVDIGVVRLDNYNQREHRFSAKRPIPITSLTPNALPRDNKSYLLLGVPASKSKLHFRDRCVYATYYPLLTSNAPYEKYKLLSIKPYSNIILDYNDKRCFSVVGAKANFPNLEGMSGSPIYLFEDRLGIFDPHDTPIVGIFTDYIRNIKSLIATDIRYAKYLIGCLKNK